MKKQLTPEDIKQREKYVKGMKKSDGAEFEKRYPGRGKDVMYATATKMAMKESYKDFFKNRLFEQLALSEADYQGTEEGVPVFTPSPPSPPTPGGGAVRLRLPSDSQPVKKPAKPLSWEEEQAEARDRRQRNRTPSSYQ